ncbi:hypothetical protein ACFQV4_20525 [Streptomyces thermocarboxydus]
MILVLAVIVAALVVTIAVLVTSDEDGPDTEPTETATGGPSLDLPRSSRPGCCPRTSPRNCLPASRPRCPATSRADCPPRCPADLSRCCRGWRAWTPADASRRPTRPAGTPAL